MGDTLTMLIPGVKLNCDEWLLKREIRMKKCHLDARCDVVVAVLIGLVNPAI